MPCVAGHVVERVRIEVIWYAALVATLTSSIFITIPDGLDLGELPFCTAPIGAENAE
jgi:hypothetical protein